MMLTDEEMYKYWCDAIKEAERVNPTAGDAHIRYARAVIEANNAKVLADLQSIGHQYQTVSAIIQERDALAARVEKFEAWLEYDANCPCCGQSVECLDECTYATDAPHDHDKMQKVRNVLKATP